MTTPHKTLKNNVPPKELTAGKILGQVGADEHEPTTHQIVQYLAKKESFSTEKAQTIEKYLSQNPEVRAAALAGGEELRRATKNARPRYFSLGLLSVVSLVICLGLGIGWEMYYHYAKINADFKKLQLMKAEAERLKKFEEEKENQARQQLAEIQSQLDELEHQLAVANKEIEREKIRQQMRAQQEAKNRLWNEREEMKRDEIKRAKKLKIGKCPPNDPLCGVD